MGLLISDTMLIDPMLDDTTWLRDSLGAWAYALDVASNRHEDESSDSPTEIAPSRDWMRWPLIVAPAVEDGPYA
jgi:hypothetical protein